MKKITGILLSILLLSGIIVNAQGKFDVGLTIKNMHYWRGLRVSNGFVTAPTVGYYNSGFSAFVWGGMSVDGNYKEVTHIVSYVKNGFGITYTDIFNFSGVKNVEFFNYKQDETIHLCDLALSYDFQDKLPLRLTWATILYGNDRAAESGNSRYSTYTEAAFPVKMESYNIEPFIAAGFALNGNDGKSLYTDNEVAGIVNVGLAVGKKVMIGNYALAVTGKLGYNLALNQASVEIAMKLF